MSTEDDPEYWERIREEYVSQGPRGISVFGHPGPRVEYAGFDRGDEDLLKYDDDIRKAAGEDYSMDNFSDEDLDKGETLDDGESDFIEENQWIECQEVKTGRIFFYHRDSLTLVSDLEKLEFQGPSGRIFRVIESKKGYRYDKANNYDEEDNLISEGIAKTEEQMLTQLSSWEIQADGLLRQKFLSEDIRERLEDIRLRLNQLMSVVENEQSHQDKSDVERVVDLTAQKWNMDNEEVHGYRARVSRFNHLQYRFRDFNFPQYYSISPLPETHLKSLECNITMPKEVALTMESNKLKFYIHPNDTANALIERIHDMLSDEARQSINLDLYVLKGVGLWEYFDGEDLMYHYETVRHCLRRRTTLELVLVPYPPEGIVSEASTANERDYLSKVIPDLPVLDPHDFRDIDIENSSWDTLEYFPMYQMDWPYRLKVVGIDHISALALPKLESNNVMKVYVKTFL